MRYLPAIALAMLVLDAGAQGTQVRAELDTAVLRIGEQARLELVVTWTGEPADISVQWPMLADTLNAHVEVVATLPVDTILRHADGLPDKHALRLPMIITSFDSGYWAIAPFRIGVDGDTLETMPLLLEVRTVPVDTAADARDIKEIEVLPFSLMYWLRQHWPWVAGGVAAILAALLLVRWLRRRKPVAGDDTPPPPELPLVDRTLLALQRVEQQRLWQDGRHKEYHSAVTDILRGYIEERFDVAALERTTDELLQLMRLTSASNEAAARLGNLLRLADMVKFAKLVPAPVENELMMEGAIRFVNETTPEPRSEQKRADGN